MIVSHEHQFIFLKTKKTAGTSVEIALSRHCGPDDMITAVSRRDEELRREYGGRGPQNHELARDLGPGHRSAYSHMRAARARRLLGREVWDRYFKFTIERNPWDLVVSSYKYVYRRADRPAPPFSEFVDSLPKMRWNSEIYRIQGEIAVDKVCLYESLEAELEDVRQRLGLPPLELPHAKGGHRDERDYRDLYGPEDVEKVRVLFADTIETFGYEF